MTTILVLNAISLLATLGIGGFLISKHRQARSRAVVQPIYVTAGTTRPLPHR